MTVEKLGKMGIRVHGLALGGADLTSSAGKINMNVISSVAQFERDLLIERTQAGLARAKAQGKRPGRPAALTPDQRQDARNRIANGETISAIAREMKTSRQTIMRVAAEIIRRSARVTSPGHAQKDQHRAAAT